MAKAKEDEIEFEAEQDTPEGQPNLSNKSENLLQDSHGDKKESKQEQKSEHIREKTSIEAIKFMQNRLISEFNDEDSQILFKYYSITKDAKELSPIDIRHMLFDLIRAINTCDIIKGFYPLFIPDECLELILKELCLQKKKTISWIEFKSFFVFLQDKPLFKLFQIITSVYNIKDFNNAKVINIIKKPFKDQNKTYQNSEMLQKNEYETKIWQGIIKNNVLPSAKSIFVYKNDNFNLSCLCLGIKEENELKNENENEAKSAEIEIDNVKYEIIMKKFDYKTEIFPKIYRGGGMKSKISRKIADTYVYAKEWDKNHLKIGEKTDKLIKNVSKKITDIDENYKISENIKDKLDKFKKSESVKNIKTGIDSMAKNIDEKLRITDKYEKVSKKVNENEKIQKIKKSVAQFVNDTSQNIKDIKYETKQNIVQKESELSQNKKNENIYNNDEFDEMSNNNNNNNNNDELVSKDKDEVMHIID